jgi:hypothetical protein
LKVALAFSILRVAFAGRVFLALVANAGRIGDVDELVVTEKELSPHA